MNACRAYLVSSYLSFIIAPSKNLKVTLKSGNDTSTEWQQNLPAQQTPILKSARRRLFVKLKSHFGLECLKISPDRR